VASPRSAAGGYLVTSLVTDLLTVAGPGAATLGYDAVKALVRKALGGGLVAPKPAGRRWKPGRWLVGVSAWRIAGLAAVLAGRKRPALREEWREHLSGLPAWRKVGAALGFVVAAVRYRLRDAADVAWIPADAVLRSRLLSNLMVGTPMVTAMAILFRHDGIDGVIASWESIAGIGGSLYALIRVGRWWRGVKPQDPKRAASASDQEVPGPGKG
jgi:hypothetical protein